jgi:hypothetical protein
MTKQFYLTPAAGKRLIAGAVIESPVVSSALKNGTVVVIMGSTNAYIANELLKRAGREDYVNFGEFHRGVSLPAGYISKPVKMRGDLVLKRGIPEFTDALGEVCSNLGENDVIIKGANAVNIELRQAGVLIGSKETSGTLGIALKSKAKKIFPAGVEKRVNLDLRQLEAELCVPSNTDLWLRCGGEPFTELDAMRLLCGVKARIFAGGGICGAEGGVYFLAEGDEEQLGKLKTLIDEAAGEPPVTF